MPWCEECSKYLTPNSMTDEGNCPRCGAHIADSVQAVGDEEKAPWHFKLLVAGVVIYLGWRIVDWVA